MNALDRILANAMTWKDLTQWLRTGFFTGLFFGLLFLGEAVLVLITLGSDRRGAAGPLVLGVLQSFMGIYAFMIAARSARQTSGEIASGTFQLYILAGLTQNSVIKGKLRSLFVQLLFGLFCVSPYLFFTYLLGGVDFYRIAGVIANLCLWSFPLNLCALIFGFQRPESNLLFTAVKIGCAGFLILMLLLVAGGMLKDLIDAEMFEPGLTASLIKGALTLNLKRILAAIVLFFIYSCGCLLLYGLAEGHLTSTFPALNSLDSIRYRRACQLLGVEYIDPEDIDMILKGQPCGYRTENEAASVRSEPAKGGAA